MCQAYPSDSKVILLDHEFQLAGTLSFWDALPHRPSGSKSREVEGVSCSSSSGLVRLLLRNTDHTAKRQRGLDLGLVRPPHRHLGVSANQGPGKMGVAFDHIGVRSRHLPGLSYWFVLSSEECSKSHRHLRNARSRHLQWSGALAD